MTYPLRSSLASKVESGPMTDAEVRAHCHAAYHRDGVICLKADWFTNWADRTQLQLLADKAFGKRKSSP